MKKQSGISFGRRILSLMMVLLMAIPWVSAPAMAATNWNGLDIKVYWFDENNNQSYSNSASQVSWMKDYDAFWLSVPGNTPLSSLFLSISYPDHSDYTFNPGSDTSLGQVANAGDLTSASIPISVFDSNQNQVGSFNLYISTNPVPEEPAAAEANIDVLYQDINGNQLKEKGSFHAVDGQDNRITPDNNGIPNGYTLVDPTEYTITFTNGQPNTTSVTFKYNPPAAAEANIDVLYQDINGNQLKEKGSFHAVDGQDNRITPDNNGIPNGYTLVDPTEYTITFANGQPNTTSVTFKYNPPAAAEANIDVLYQDINGNQLKEKGSFHAVDGQDNRITPDNNGIPNGYTLVDPTEYTITFANGQPNTTSVTFKYNPPASAEANIDVLYQDINGNQLKEKGSFHAVDGQDNRITPDNNGIPNGYTLADPTEYTITFANGQPNTTSVTFKYNPPAQTEPAKATIDVLYVDATTSQQLKEKGSFSAVEGQPNRITPDNTNIPQGYTLADPTEYTITFANGQPNTTSVTFYYNPPAPTEAAKATIDVLYVDATTSQQLKEKGTFTAVDGQPNRITPDNTNIPQGYTLADPTEYTITFANGQPSTTSVTFYYNPPAPTEAAKATIDVLYVDATTSQQLKEKGTFTAVDGQPNRITPDNTNIPQGYTLADPTEYTITFANGQPNTTSVTFYYNPPVQTEPAKATIDVLYVDATTSQQLKEKGSFSAVDGQPNRITPDNTNIPQGYTLADPTEYTITFANGQPSTTSVTFKYNPPAPAPTPTPTAIPIGSPIDLWATTNSKVNFRSTPAIANNNVIKSLSKDTHVWMYESQLTAADEVWTRVRVDGQDGYIKTEFLEMMTKAQSDQYQASLPTPMPTRSPAPNVTATPVPSATPTSMPAQYQGYALTTRQVALRTEVSDSDQSILATLPQTTLVNVVGQVYQGTTPWSLVTTVTNVQGYVPDDALRRITPEEAKYYLDQLKTPTPTISSQPTPTPNQQHGYAATLGDNVPMRGAANPNSSLVNMLAKNVVVFINSQEYLDGVAWHAVKFGEQWGYIRADQLRWLSQAETDAYLNTLKSPTPPPSSVTPPPVGPNSPSSYGYVSSKSVNFRSSPSTTSSNKISTLNEYAFALVLSTTQVDGKTWYKVNQGGKEGYIMGDYFHVLTLAELEDFLQSPEYTKGVTGGTNNNNNTGNNGGSSELPTTPEDWNVGTWTNPNSGLNATYEPFDPFATPEPLPTASPSPTPEPFETLPPPTDPPVETQSDSPSFLWLGLGITALAGFGGLYAYALHKSNQRKAAARAAQRRAAMQQQNAQTGARPYARATNAPMVPPTAGTQTKQAPPAGAPRPQAPGGAPSPYSQRPAQPPTGTGSGQYTSSTRPVQPGSTQMPRPSQQSNAYARPQQPGTPSSNRPEAQGIAGGQGNMTGQNGANSATSRQPRAGRHTGPDQNVPTDTNQDA